MILRDVVVAQADQPLRLYSALRWFRRRFTPRGRTLARRLEACTAVSDTAATSLWRLAKGGHEAKALVRPIDAGSVRRLLTVSTSRAWCLRG
jgi:hypothetical protein